MNYYCEIIRELIILSWRVMKCIREMIIKLEFKECVVFWVVFYGSKIRSLKGKFGVFGGEGKKFNVVEL